MKVKVLEDAAVAASVAAPLQNSRVHQALMPTARQETD